MRPFPPALAALIALLTLAAAPAAASPVPAPAQVPPAQAVSLPRLGLVFDAGLPSGAGILLQGRIFDGLRVQAGPMWSGVGWGVKGGLVLAPFQWAVSPTLEAEGGYGFQADLSLLANRSGVPSELKPVLAHARYWYTAGYLGLDFGSQRGLSFFLRGGLARLQITASGTAHSTDKNGTLDIGGASLTATVPCAKLGLQYWF